MFARSDKQKLTTPKILFAKTPEDLEARAASLRRKVRRLRNRIVKMEGPRTVENTLGPFDEMSRVLAEALSQPSFLFNVHPDKAARDAGDKAYQEAEKLSTELSLDRKLYEALAAIDAVAADPETRHALEKILRDFRLAGVDRDEATRKKVKALRDEITAISQEFDKNINEDVRSISLAGPEDLDGLPEDYVRSHPPGENGRITITTNYPDSIPFLRYARRAEHRKALQTEFLNRAYPKNLKILRRLLETRHELATTLGYANYAELATVDKMTGSATVARDFIAKVAAVAEPRAKEDYAQLLARKRKDEPSAERIERWDMNYYTELLRAEAYAFDKKLLRPYFQFEKVRDALFDLSRRLFHLGVRKVDGVDVWHPSVEVYDVYDGRTRIGRFYLDLHPRDGKFTHAAAAPLLVGIAGGPIPQAALMCNFPDPRKVEGPALMDFDEVDTFFHEFGHLLHMILCGRVRWAKNSTDGIEWDFIEAPSQMLEEWVRDPKVLRKFAIHHETGERVPANLVRQMRRAEAFGRAYEAQRQLLYATLSMTYYDRDPRGLDPDAVVADVHGKFPLIPMLEGTHFQCNFGHLTGYSAIYYTYMWSLVIAKDLFSRFRAQKDLLRPEEAMRYRKAVLEPGSSRLAEDLVRDFLGRERSFEPFEAYLREAA